MKRSAFLLSVVLLNASLMRAQWRTFEVASVKPSVSGVNGVQGGCHGIDSKYGSGPMAGRPPLGRCVITDGRLSHFIGIAWGVTMQNLKTGPDWIERGDERFNIEAKAENPRTATEEQLLHMLQALLIERFKLKFHREEIERPGFALMVAKSGPKLQASAFPDEAINMAGGKPSPGRPVLLNVRRFSMARLAEMLSGYGPGPTVDKTGLTGEYDFKLAWNDNAGPSVFSALQDQLGLRLEPRKVPISLFVVDSAQKPEPE
jgi:uncharacterized protein (TIGR03435 family)